MIERLLNEHKELAQISRMPPIELPRLTACLLSLLPAKQIE